jgi:hypothetical protein
MTLAKSKKTDESVIIEQRKNHTRRAAADRRSANAAAVVERRLGERREKVSRRRQIDPTTCERDYTDAEVEFMHALDQYKRSSGRMFPTCSEVLEVLRNLGYEKKEGFVAVAPAPNSSASICGEQC